MRQLSDKEAMQVWMVKELKELDSWVDSEVSASKAFIKVLYKRKLIHNKSIIIGNVLLAANVFFGVVMAINPLEHSALTQGSLIAVHILAICVMYKSNAAETKLVSEIDFEVENSKTKLARFIDKAAKIKGGITTACNNADSAVISGWKAFMAKNA